MESTKLLRAHNKFAELSTQAAGASEAINKLQHQLAAETRSLIEQLAETSRQTQAVTETHGQKFELANATSVTMLVSLSLSLIRLFKGD